MNIPIAPMLAHAPHADTVIDDFNANEWWLEEKYDGHRIVTLVAHGVVTAWSRGNKIRELAPHINIGMSRMADGIYDGELIVPGGTSTDVTALNRMHEHELVLFDMMRAGQKDITYLPNDKRREWLGGAMQNTTHAIRLGSQCRPSQDALLNIWTKGGEGAIMKRIGAVYQPGARSWDWVKFKLHPHAEVTVTEFEEGLLGPHSKIICVDAHGVTVTVKSLNDCWRADFAKAAASFIGRTLVIEYQGKTKKGKYTQPRADHFL